MATQDYNLIRLTKFWDDEFKTLDYRCEPFNDPDSVNEWTTLGFTSRFVGDMCDMRLPQPSWNQRFVDMFEARGWRDIGTSYYRMLPGTVLPRHKDLYKRYVEIFNLEGREDTIWRAVIFLEDWKPGHYLDIMDHPVVDWVAGDGVVWRYDVPHTAANVGYEPRYTLQITGHL